MEEIKDEFGIKREIPRFIPFEQIEALDIDEEVLDFALEVMRATGEALPRPMGELLLMDRHWFQQVFLYKAVKDMVKYRQ